MSAENLTRDEAAARSRLLRIASYDVHLDLTTARDESQHFLSTSTVAFECAEAGATTHIDITADRIVSAALNGEPIDTATAFTGQRLAVTPAAGGNELHVVAWCTYSRSGEGLHRFVDPVDKEVYLYTQFETFDAHRMFACFDQPDLKATFRFVVDAPEEWLVLSNMPSTTSGGHHVFDPTPLQSSYITAIVAAILSMANALDIEVVAEGVETDDQLRWLREHRCHFAQGYLLARPLKPEQLAAAVT